MKVQPNFPKFSLTLVTGLSLALTLVFLTWVNFNSRKSRLSTTSEIACQQIVKSSALLDSSQLSKLQAKEGVNKDAIAKVLGEPYCVLPKASIRSGAITERAVYPIKDQGRLIIAYEDNRYLGYGLEKSNSNPLNWFQQHTNKSNLKQIDLKKTWEINAGETIAGYRVLGGLGEVSLEYSGVVKAPTNGTLESEYVFVTDQSLIRGTADCAIFSSPYYPAYLLKICGFKDKNLGWVNSGQPLGNIKTNLHFALLTFRPITSNKSQWVYVSPSPKLIENLVKSP